MRTLAVIVIACVAFSSSTLSRTWKPTPAQIASDYASINHNRGNGEFVTIGWWAAPTARPGTQIRSVLERYVLISVTHSHLNVREPADGLRFDNIDRLEVRDESGNALSPLEQDTLPPADIGLLSTFEAGYRNGLGPRGKGTKFFVFDAGPVRACEKGGISVPYAGETYTWETPFPGCIEEKQRRAVISPPAIENGGRPPFSGAYPSQENPNVKPTICERISAEQASRLNRNYHGSGTLDRRDGRVTIETPCGTVVCIAGGGYGRPSDSMLDGPRIGPASPRICEWPVRREGKHECAAVEFNQL
jgi:hypothetical protein